MGPSFMGLQSLGGKNPFFFGSGTAGEMLGTEKCLKHWCHAGNFHQTSIGGLEVSSKALIVGSLEIH